MANFCPQCGSPTDPTKAFCENCGTKLIIFNEPTSPQPVQPEAPVSAPAANLNDGYVIPEESAAPSYPETPQNTYAQNSDFTIPHPSAPQNAGPSPAGPGANPFIQRDLSCLRRQSRPENPVKTCFRSFLRCWLCLWVHCIS